MGLEGVEGARAVHHAYSVDVLVPNRRETLEAFPEIPCDRATIDDYLRLTLKGASNAPFPLPSLPQ